jgi:hypothetical protein
MGRRHGIHCTARIGPALTHYVGISDAFVQDFADSTGDGGNKMEMGPAWPDASFRDKTEWFPYGEKVGPGGCRRESPSFA